MQRTWHAAKRAAERLACEARYSTSALRPILPCWHAAWHSPAQDACEIRIRGVVAMPASRSMGCVDTQLRPMVLAS